MKVFVQIIDSLTGTSQYGMIEESTQKGFEILNAINHFIKVENSEIEWKYFDPTFKCGKIKDTSKNISIITI